jgi:Fe-S-cluster-containing dehydrogenase component
MKKCTLCVDKIYNETIPEAERVPACVSTCPVSARHFGDLGDPDSDVSKLVAERSGYDLSPELGYKPTNKYLPPRDRSVQPAMATEDFSEQPQGLLRWVDRILSL